MLTAIWALEAAALAYVGRHTGLGLLEYFALPAWLLAAGASLLAVPSLLTPQETVILNGRFVTFAFVVSAALLIVHLQLRVAASRADARPLAESVLWLATPLLLFAVSLEVHDAMEGSRATSDTAEWFVMATLWAVVAFALHMLTIGAKLRSTSLLTFIIFGAASVTVLVLLGLGGLDEPWRVFVNWRFGSMAVIGAAMTVAAWLRCYWSETEEPPADALWLPGVVMLALAPSVETYTGVAEAVTTAPVPSGLLAAAAVWVVVSAAGCALGTTKRLPALQAFTIIMTFGGIALTIIASELPANDLWAPFVNLRVLAFAACIAAVAVESRLMRITEAADGSDEPGLAAASALAVFAALLALWPITKEIFVAFLWSEYPSAEMWRNAAQVAISLSWGAYAAVCLAWGMTRRNRIARWLGLIVLAAAVLKLFIWDLSFLEQPYRILSFGVLGLVLVGVAWAYSRYSERLRELT